jgi:hypothetical protein
MKSSNVKIIDITKKLNYEKYLYKCLSPIPFRKYKKRSEYLELAIPKGFHKKILIFNGEVVGQIEYAPAKVSGYPIIGDDLIVMNCIWVLRKAKGHNFGKKLLFSMIEDNKSASGFATIALENHWSGWFKKEQIMKLGFKPIDYIKVSHKLKHKNEYFKIYLMWLPINKNAIKPKCYKSKLLEGIDFCIAHPLYHPEKLKLREIFIKH